MVSTVVSFFQKHYGDILVFVYAASLFVTHVFGENTVVYKAAKWVLSGKLPGSHPQA